MPFVPAGFKVTKGQELIEIRDGKQYINFSKLEPIELPPEIEFDPDFNPFELPEWFLALRKKPHERDEFDWWAIKDYREIEERREKLGIEPWEDYETNIREAE